MWTGRLRREALQLEVLSSDFRREVAKKSLSTAAGGMPHPHPEATETFQSGSGSGSASAGCRAQPLLAALPPQTQVRTTTLVKQRLQKRRVQVRWEGARPARTDARWQGNDHRTKPRFWNPRCPGLHRVHPKARREALIPGPQNGTVFAGSSVTGVPIERDEDTDPRRGTATRGR